MLILHCILVIRGLWIQHGVLEKLKYYNVVYVHYDILYVLAKNSVKKFWVPYIVYL